MIPKKIHYCWFGGNEKSGLSKRCIKSWIKKCPDYEIIEWNENNFDISCAPLYVRQAYEQKKWAFVSDYVRLWALYNYGGIYMDTDVQIVSDVDRILDFKAVSGFEHGNYIQTAFMASEPELKIFRELLDEYDTISFIKEDGSFDTTPNVQRFTERLISYGLVRDNTLQTIGEVTVFPIEYFAPKDFITGILSKTKNTIAIHHYDGTWLKPEDFRERNRRWREWRLKNIKEKILCRLKTKGGRYDSN